MSLDIFFQSARFTGKSAIKKNPFTGEAMTVNPAEPLTAAEVKALRTVLKQVHAKGPDDDGCYAIDLKDGGTAEVYADKLKSGCMISLGGITPDLSQFLLDFLKAGNWVMLPAMEDAVAIAASPECVKGVPDDFPRLVICNSAKEVAVLLTKGVKAWQKYRNQVVRGG